MVRKIAVSVLLLCVLVAANVVYGDVREAREGQIFECSTAMQLVTASGAMLVAAADTNCELKCYDQNKKLTNTLKWKCPADKSCDGNCVTGKTGCKNTK